MEENFAIFKSKSARLIHEFSAMRSLTVFFCNLSLFQTKVWIHPHANIQTHFSVHFLIGAPGVSDDIKTRVLKGIQVAEIFHFIQTELDCRRTLYFRRHYSTLFCVTLMKFVSNFRSFSLNFFCHL